MKFNTIFQEGQDEFVEKKSRFIGYAFPVESEEEIQLYLEEIRKAHWNASHNNVYAYILGTSKPVERFSDAGEPVHTAGLPILDILKAKGLRNVLVIVVRYFGGTLLGTGGLVRAYSHSGQIALEAAGIIEKRSYLKYDLPMEYTQLGKMQYGMMQEGFAIQDTEYTDQVVMKLLIDKERQEEFEKKVTSLSEGRLKPVLQEEVLAAEHEGQWHFYDMPEN